MSESATDAKLRDLLRQLRDEKTAHAATSNQLQAENQRVWGLTPVNLTVLMHQMPPLKGLILLVSEAIGLANPLRGAPIEDTMRTQFVHVGENASTSATEAGVHTHHKPRADLVEIERRLRHVTDELGRLVGAPQTGYNPPTGRCPECGRLLFQNAIGRNKEYCTAKCRVRASRKVEA